MTRFRDELNNIQVWASPQNASVLAHCTTNIFYMYVQLAAGQLFFVHDVKRKIVMKPVALRAVVQQVEDDTEILNRYNVWGRGPKFWTGT